MVLLLLAKDSKAGCLFRSNFLKQVVIEIQKNGTSPSKILKVPPPDSILGAGSQLTQKFNQLLQIFKKLCKEDLLVNIFKCVEGIFDILFTSEDMADFLNSQGKLEP